MVFIDYEEAFNSVDTPAIFEAMRHQGMLETYVNTSVDISKD